MTEIDEKEVNESLALPEAPVSITVKGYFTGFSVLITKRNAEGTVDMDGIEKAINNMISRGFNPSWNDDTNGKQLPKKVEVDQATCPHTNVTLKKATGHNNPANAGKIYKACLDCGKFLEWKEKQGFEKDMEEGRSFDEFRKDELGA